MAVQSGSGLFGRAMRQTNVKEFFTFAPTVEGSSLSSSSRATLETTSSSASTSTSKVNEEQQPTDSDVFDHEEIEPKGLVEASEVELLGRKSSVVLEALDLNQMYIKNGLTPFGDKENEHPRPFNSTDEEAFQGNSSISVWKGKGRGKGKSKRQWQCSGSSSSKRKRNLSQGEESASLSESESRQHNDDNDEYVAEKILDYRWCPDQRVGQYYIKWDGYSEDGNTWEPIENLQTCKDLLKQFYSSRLEKSDKLSREEKEKLLVPPDPNSQFFNRHKLLNKFFCSPSFAMVEDFYIKHRNKIDSECISYKEFSNQLNAMEDTPWHKRRGKIWNKLVEKLTYQLMLRHAKGARDRQVERLKNWQEEINRQEHTLVAVENDYDLEGPPCQMTYITEYIVPDSIDYVKEAWVFCSCKNGCSAKNTEEQCCPLIHEALFPYNKFGRFRLGKGSAIYECNKNCQCSNNCYNRVVQKGRQVKLSIFKTSTGKGWGVKALEPIKRGTFIVEYVGEVIESKTAEEREQLYDEIGRTYLFDLDFFERPSRYTVDAFNHGNLSHFVNHSCDPNMHICAVFVDVLYHALPRLALFALRDIKRGEEITFDYKVDNEEEYFKTLKNVSPKTAAKLLKAEERRKKNNRKILKNDTKDSAPETPEASAALAAPSEPEPKSEPATEVPSNAGQVESMPGIFTALDDPLVNTNADDSIDVEESTNRTRCRCGAKNCRKFIF